MAGKKTHDKTELAERGFAQLVEAAQTDDDALTALLDRCESKFRIVARVSLGPMLRSQVDTLDLVQSMKRVLIPGLRTGRFDLASPEQLVALAATIIRRKVALYWRRQQRRQVYSLADEKDLPLGLISVEDDGADRLDDDELLNSLLDQLDPEDREIFQMQLEGLSIVEIARRTGRRAGPLRAHLSRLRRKLREKIDARLL